MKNLPFSFPYRGRRTAVLLLALLLLCALPLYARADDPVPSPATSPEASPSTSPEASPSTSPEASPSTSPEASPSTSPGALLPAAANLRWSDSESGTAQWDAVPGALSYTLQVYRGGTEAIHALTQGVVADVTELSYDLSDLMADYGAGAYYFTVRAVDAAAQPGAESAPSAAFHLYAVSLPVGEGIAASVEAGSVSPVEEGGSFAFRIAIAKGYSQGPNYAVKANGKALKPDTGGLYTLTDIRESITITISDLVAGGTIANIPVITTLSLPNGAMGRAYEQTPALEKAETVTWSAVGALPDGLSLDAATGRLSGTPTRPGEWSFTLRAANTVGEAKRLFQLTVTGEDYSLAAGNDGEWTRGGEGTLAFRAAVPAGEALTAVLVDGMEAKGSGVSLSGAALTLRPAFLKTLTMGQHDLTLIYTFGLAEGRFSIVQSDPSVAPSLLTQPADASGVAGGSVTFSVAAEGTLPLVCQWQVDRNDGNGWVRLKGAAAATLTVEALQESMDGWRYRCVVTNRSGVAESEAAVLTVTPDTALAAEGGGGAGLALAALALVAVGGGGYYFWRRRKPGAAPAAEAGHDAPVDPAGDAPVEPANPAGNVPTDPGNMPAGAPAPEESASGVPSDKT